MIRRHILTFKLQDPELQCCLRKTMISLKTIPIKCPVPRTTYLYWDIFCLQEDPETRLVRSWQLLDNLSYLEQVLSYMAKEWAKTVPHLEINLKEIVNQERTVVWIHKSGEEVRHTYRIKSALKSNQKEIFTLRCFKILVSLFPRSLGTFLPHAKFFRL